MGNFDRKLQRKKSSGNKPTLTKEALDEIKKLPTLLESTIKVNEILTAENKRIHEAVGEILEEHANRIASLERSLKTLKEK